MAFVGALEGMESARLANDRASLAQLQQATGALGLMENLNKMQHAANIRDILASDIPQEQKQAALMRIPGGIEILSKLAELNNKSSQGALHAAQAKGLETSQMAQTGLARYMSGDPSMWGGSRPTRVIPDENEALKAAIAADAAGQPFDIGVPNPANIRALSVLADPKAAIAELVKTPTPQRGTVVPPGAAYLPPGSTTPVYVNPATSPGVHFERGVDEKGNVVVHTFDKTGKLLDSVNTNTLAPSWSNNTNIAERQLRGQLETAIKPHTVVMDAYQRYNQIRSTGDNSQANQFLAQQMMQMSKTGQRVIPKAELERILGSGDLGNDWMGRAANIVTQLAAGVRTPSIDKRLNDLADAMAEASANRIGQEIQNMRAKSPPGLSPDRVLSRPLIYGRFIISPTGKVHAFRNSEEAQAKLAEAEQKILQEQQNRLNQ